jgi:hypothetical protein
MKRLMMRSAVMLSLIAMAVGGAAFGQMPVQTPNPAQPGKPVTVSAPVTITSACAGCTVYLALNDVAGTQILAPPPVTASFAANAPTPITTTFTVPSTTAAASYQLFYNVFNGSTAVANGVGVLASVVVGAPAASAPLTLSWLAPTANADGSTPANVSGYNLYTALSDSALTALGTVAANAAPICPVGGPFVGCAVSVKGAAVLSYKMLGLPIGTYYFAVTAWYCPAAGPCTESKQSVHVSGSVAALVTTPGAPSGLSANGA